MTAAYPSNRPAMHISKRVRDIPQALSIYFNQIVYHLTRRGYDVTSLSLGEAFFDIPLFDFTKLDVTKGYHYTDSQGIPELRNKIADFYIKQYGAPVDGEKELLISAGSKPIIFMAMETVLDPGDEVAILEPAWVSYKEQANLVGAKPYFIPYEAEIADLAKYYTPKTRMLIINNPNNPAGRLYSREELRELYEQCRARGIYILIDEAYSDFVIDEPFISMAEVVPDKDGILIVNSLSKNMGISGWRIGYVIAQPAVIQALLKVNQHLITCAPSILLQYVNRYFEQITAVTLPQVRSVVEKRNRISEMLDRLKFKRLHGASTFYFFVSIEDYPGTSMDFCLHMILTHNISVVPGSAYGNSTERFIRVSIGTESEERIWQALLLLRDEIDHPTFSTDAINQRLGELEIAPFLPSP